MLFIVATPIGNLDDLSLRQAKTLMKSDVILAEDTRSARILLSKISQSFPNLPNNPNIPNIISYYKENEFEKLPQIIDLLKENKTVSLISESGMPLISDPGYLLVKIAIKENLPFTVIPGSSAATTALIYSGFNPSHYMFLGFLPKKESHLLQLINRLKQVKVLFFDLAFVFFESPKRINKTLELINEVAPDTEIAICRELTKKFEETVRGKPKDLMERTYKGEITLVLSFPRM